LRLTTFGKHSVEEFRKALGDGKGCPFDAIVIDLRNNAGGLLDAAVDTCRLLIDEGRIVSTRGRDGHERSSYNANGTAVIAKSVPMVVLVNRFSASASEIVAACLQDHHRAVVIGERTWGKGTVQNLFPLEGGHSALKLTTASYWRPSGKNIHRLKDAPITGNWGVSPDPGFEVTLSDEELERFVRLRRDRDLGNSVKSIVEGALKNTNGKKDESATKPTSEGATVRPATPPTSSDSTKKESTEDKPAEPSPSKPLSNDDPQLRKAIEYLEQQLNDRSSKKPGTSVTEKWSALSSRAAAA
jgi:carboxyl-terminal processing protease